MAIKIGGGFPLFLGMLFLAVIIPNNIVCDVGYAVCNIVYGASYSIPGIINDGTSVVAVVRTVGNIVYIAAVAVGVIVVKAGSHVSAVICGIRAVSVSGGGSVDSGVPGCGAVCSRCAGAGSVVCSGIIRCGRAIVGIVLRRSAVVSVVGIPIATCSYKSEHEDNKRN